MVCSLWPRHVGNVSFAPCKASPIPATLPWPKIAQMPSINRSPSSVICTESQRTMAWAAVKRMVFMLLLLRESRAASQMPQRRRKFSAIVATAVASSILPAIHCTADIGVDGAADREAFDQREIGGEFEGRGQFRLGLPQPQNHDALGMRIAAGDGVAGGTPMPRRSASAPASTNRGRCRCRKSG